MTLAIRRAIARAIPCSLSAVLARPDGYLVALTMEASDEDCATLARDLTAAVAIDADGWLVDVSIGTYHGSPDGTVDILVRHEPTVRRDLGADNDEPDEGRTWIYESEGSRLVLTDGYRAEWRNPDGTVPEPAQHAADWASEIAHEPGPLARVVHWLAYCPQTGERHEGVATVDAARAAGGAS